VGEALEGTVDRMTVASDFEARRQAIVEAHLKPAEDRPPSSARGVHHLAMICSDVERTVRFYQDVLGFPLVDVMENRDYPGSTHFFLDIGHDNLLAFFDFPGLGLEEAVESLGSVQHVAISVDRTSFEAIRDRLDAGGIPYVGPDRGLTNSIYVKDPDGIQIELLAEPLRIMDGRHLG
jgi:glyoxylase I family protein